MVVHRELSPRDWTQVSLIVREGETWRLAEYTATFAVPTSGTPNADEADPAGLIQIEVDVANPANTVLEGRVFAGIPVAMTLFNPGPDLVSVRIGDQALGSVEPGETVRIVPFVVPSAIQSGTEAEVAVMVTTTNGPGQEVVTTWPVAPGGRPIPFGFGDPLATSRDSPSPSRRSSG